MFDPSYEPLILGFGFCAIGSAGFATWIGSIEQAHAALTSDTGFDNSGLSAVNDVTIIHRGRSHQLDHVVLGSDRLFVIETKTWRGHVTGSPGGEHWTLRRPDQSNVRLYNPLLQNQTHATALSKLLNVPVVPIALSAGHFTAAPQIAGEFIRLKELITRLDQPGISTPHALAAFARLQSIKSARRQVKLSQRHRARLDRRYNRHLSKALWAVSLASLVVTSLATYHAGTG
jgi:hypothetical protein